MKKFNDITRKQKAVASMIGSALVLVLTVLCIGWTLKGSIPAIFAGVATAYFTCVLADKAHYEWLRHKRAMRASE